MENISSLHVIFEGPYYSLSDVPTGIMCQTPLVLDPSNPRNNLMHGFKKEALEYFSRAATWTLQKLNSTGEKWMGNGMRVYPFVKEAFVPQPLIFDQNSDTYKPTLWAIGNLTVSHLSQPSLTIRNPSLKNKHIIARILRSFAAYLHAVVIEGQYRSLDLHSFVRQEAKNFVQLVFNQTTVDQTSLTVLRDAFDITFVIPIMRDEIAIHISSKWETPVK